MRIANPINLEPMFIPSERVYREMRSEDTSFWFLPANDGADLAFLVKAPSSTIKALISGCPLRLLFGRNGPYLNAGVHIYDTPDAPIMIAGSQHEAEEHQALLRILSERRLPIFLFNEMDICLASGNLELTKEAVSQVAEMICDIRTLYVGPLTTECSHALDCFCHSADSTDKYQDASTIPLVNVPTVLGQWRINHVSFVGFHDYHTITIDDHDEGEMFERAVWASFESIFPLTLYKSAQITIGGKTREFIDVLAFYENGSFLIEAKDLSVLRAGFERNQERRTKGVQHQIEKAIDQLIGASKAVTRGEHVFDANKKELDIVRDKPAHCIVLITELMHSGDWSAIETQLRNAIRSTGSFFHLLDLGELIRLLKGSSGEARLFDYNLMERCKVFCQNGSVHIRSRRPDRPRE